MDSYIEVIGQAQLIEQVAEYRADLTVTARSAQPETASAEAGVLRDQCVRAMKAAGLHAYEMSEGGQTAWQPWFSRNKQGQETSYKILIGCDDANRLYRALDALQPLFANQRNTLSVSMLKPRFDARPNDKAAARVAAIADARKQAQLIAQEGGLALKGIVQVEELLATASRSGAYGDQERAAPMYIECAPLGDVPATETLGDAQRTNTLRYRIRFALATTDAS